MLTQLFDRRSRRSRLQPAPVEEGPRPGLDTGVPVQEIGEGKASNYLLRPGDVVFVPERMF